MVTIFKKGDRKDTRNYRGINIINCMAKLYDMVLSYRLKHWFKPFREQAGAQEKRGCLEHVVSLRLLCDLARRKKFILFVVFIDFSQAYDRVPRHVLFRVLCRLGCGSIMLCALIAMYKVTESWIGGALISISLGVKQGSPTSCLLFIVFMDDLIRIIKEGNICDVFFAVAAYSCFDGRYGIAINISRRNNKKSYSASKLLHFLRYGYQSKQN